MSYRAYCRVAAAGFALLVTRAGAAAPLIGHWSGSVTQHQPEQHSYGVAMRVDGQHGTIDYASLGCGGTLALVSSDGVTFVYREHITYGQDKCIDGGLLRLIADGSRLAWSWSGGGVGVDGTLGGTRVEASPREVARDNTQRVQEAVASGSRPPFQPLWDAYHYNRDVAAGLAPDENRCAIVMSLTLGLTPRDGEASLAQLANRGAVGSIVAQVKGRLGPVTTPEVSHAAIASRFYLRAQELADRLAREWGEPRQLDGAEARAAIAGKRGIVFLQHAYPRAGALGRRTGDHIDVWDADHVASSATTPFEHAEHVWFWEIH